MGFIVTGWSASAGGETGGGDSARAAADGLSWRAAAMEKKVFWSVFALLGLVADFTLPFVWALVATAPALYVSWWVAYRSDWFG